MNSRYMYLADHHMKKGKPCWRWMMDLDQEPILLDGKLWCFILFPLINYVMQYRCWCDQWSSSS